MGEVNVQIPDELESEFRAIPKLELSMLVSRVLKDKLAGLARLKRIVAKSKLTEQHAEELANEISESLAKRYRELPKA
jgi:hypothetical protein